MSHQKYTVDSMNLNYDQMYLIFHGSVDINSWWRIDVDVFQVAVKTLPFYKDYFKIAYPLPKIDLIALADFASGMCCHMCVTVCTVFARRTAKSCPVYNCKNLA